MKGEGSGFGRSVSDISNLCPKSTFPDRMAIRGSTVKNAQSKLSERLRKIKNTK